MKHIDLIKDACKAPIWNIGSKNELYLFNGLKPKKLLFNRVEPTNENVLGGDNLVYAIEIWHNNRCAFREFEEHCYGIGLAKHEDNVARMIFYSIFSSGICYAGQMSDVLNGTGKESSPRNLVEEMEPVLESIKISWDKLNSIINKAS